MAPSFSPRPHSTPQNFANPLTRQQKRLPPFGSLFAN